MPNKGGASRVVKIGEELLEYASKLGEIQETLQNAYVGVIKCIENLQSEDTYKGIATTEMNAFFASLEANIQKMIILYQTSAIYVNKVYSEMYYNEEQLVTWAINQIRGK